MIACEEVGTNVFDVKPSESTDGDACSGGEDKMVVGLEVGLEGEASAGDELRLFDGSKSTSITSGEGGGEDVIGMDTGKYELSCAWVFFSRCLTP